MNAATNLLSTGMVTAVGFNALASCAAMRPGLSGAQMTRFMFDGDFVQGAMVRMPGDLRGRDLLLSMVTMATNESLQALPAGRAGDTLLMLCLPEEDRPGRLVNLDMSFALQLRHQLTAGARLATRIELFSEGAMGGVRALERARFMIGQGDVDHCVIAGVDSYLQADALRAWHAQRRLLTQNNGDGFIPGEAAGALVVSRSALGNYPMQCLGIGFGHEPAGLGGRVSMRGVGLTTAYKAALADARCSFEDLDYRITDISGEQNAFKEAALALARTMRVRKEEFDIWHPAESIGVVGAATVPIVLGVALRASEHSYAPGPGVLSHFASDDGTRAAVILREFGKKSNPVL